MVPDPISRQDDISEPKKCGRFEASADYDRLVLGQDRVEDAAASSNYNVILLLKPGGA